MVKRYWPGGRSAVPNPAAEKSVAAATETHVLPSAESACSFTDPPPNVATADAAYLPPFQREGRRVGADIREGFAFA